MEFDIFIPSLNIGFEYQGGQHYKEVNIFPASTQNLKKVACESSL